MYEIAAEINIGNTAPHRMVRLRSEITDKSFTSKIICFQILRWYHTYRKSFKVFQLVLLTISLNS